MRRLKCEQLMDDGCQVMAGKYNEKKCKYPIPNWFPDDNLRTKCQLEARCGMCVSYEYLGQVL
jgi:hypothetical protein